MLHKEKQKSDYKNTKKCLQIWQEGRNVLLCSTLSERLIQKMCLGGPCLQVQLGNENKIVPELTSNSAVCV